jgi:hypothetical protein
LSGCFDDDPQGRRRDRDDAVGDRSWQADEIAGHRAQGAEVGHVVEFAVLDEVQFVVLGVAPDERSGLRAARYRHAGLVAAGGDHGRHRRRVTAVGNVDIVQVQSMRGVRPACFAVGDDRVGSCRDADVAVEAVAAPQVPMCRLAGMPVRRWVWVLLVGHVDFL